MDWNDMRWTRLILLFVAMCFSASLVSSGVAQTSSPTTPRRAYGPKKPDATSPNRKPLRQAAVPGVRTSRNIANQQAGPPQGFELTPHQAKIVDQMLMFWEQKTSGVKTLEAEFGRWVYNPVFGPKNAAATFTKGVVRYAAPDRGMIQEITIYKFNAAMQQQGAKWPYEEQKDAIGEHWVCDGKSVFEFNHRSKQLVETKLPENMQGNAIADGPLPFMFGAKADKIKSRYWIREIPRSDKSSPYHLELVPKRRGEDYSRIRIKLDAGTFLPTEMVLYDLNSVGRSAYVFKNLKANNTGNNVKNFFGGFVKPKTPRGWKKLVQNPAAPTVGPTRQAQAPNGSKR